MSDERNPHAGYRAQQPGEHPGQFEAEARVWHAPIRELAQVFYDIRLDYPHMGRVTIEATKPDARVILRLTIGFRPENGTEDDLNFVCTNGDKVREQIVDTVIWLAGCDSYGAGLRECEDLVGTEAVPIQMIRDGLWGVIYEVDVDVKAVRARVDFHESGLAGRWLATAKWVAVAPMSDRDWMHARERMELVVNPQRLQLCSGGTPD